MKKFSFKILLLCFVIFFTIAFSLYQLKSEAVGWKKIPIPEKADSFISYNHPLDEIIVDNIDFLKQNDDFDIAFDTEIQKFDIDSFYIDRCEVSQRDFQNFVGWLKLSQNKSKIPSIIPEGWKFKSDTSNHAIFGRLDFPANGVSFYDAYAYCELAGGSLPTAEQWYAMAAGKENRLYPWGNKPSFTPWAHIDARLNLNDKCGSKASAVTPENVMDVGSSVSEWTLGNFPQDLPEIRGGSANSKPPSLFALTFYNQKAPMEYSSPFLGFRCAYDKEKKKLPWKKENSSVAIQGGVYELGIPKEANIPSLYKILSKNDLPYLETFLNNRHSPLDSGAFITEKEITVRQYQKFLNDPLTRFGIYANENEPIKHSYFPLNWKEQQQYSNRAVVGVDWWSAYSFARWAGGRLPTEDEWVALASSAYQKFFEQKLSNPKILLRESQISHPEDTDIFVDDVTSNGVQGMIGNVSEWTRSIIVDQIGFQAVVKGSNFLLPKDQVLLSYQNVVPLHHKSHTIGLRVIFD